MDGDRFSLRETRLKHREKPHKLLQVGVIPTPATILCSNSTDRRLRAEDALHSLGRRRACSLGSELRMAGHPLPESQAILRS
jgi:hypothetical protein